MSGSKGSRDWGAFHLRISRVLGSMNHTQIRVSNSRIRFVVRTIKFQSHDDEQSTIHPRNDLRINFCPNLLTAKVMSRTLRPCLPLQRVVLSHSLQYISLGSSCADERIALPSLCRIFFREFSKRKPDD